jgi:hypothetical protein
VSRQSEYMAEVRQAKAEVGLCRASGCYESATEGVHCPPHAERNRALQRRWYEEGGRVGKTLGA